jgi:predicted PhzF superfamily epimerase YddE/YHI9
MSSVVACVDAFTDRPFEGNQAGVCLLDAPRSAAWMQCFAAEMNLPETAFVRQNGQRLQLRWFSPTTEIALCGHATLAAAHLLWREQRYPPHEAIQFHTRSGRLTATRKGDLIELDFPAEPAVETEAPGGLLEALTASPVWFGRNRLDYLAELPSESHVRDLRPDLLALARFDTRGVIVTARATARQYDFISRFFAPAVGIPEDPVTGSAHCCLAPYWAARLNKTAMVGFQASSRTGIVRVALAGSRVRLSGHAVTVYRGVLEL